MCYYPNVSTLLVLEQNPPLFCKIRYWSRRDELCSHFTRGENWTGQFSDTVGILDRNYSPVRLSPDTTHVLPVGIQSPKGLQAQSKSTLTSKHLCISETLGFIGKERTPNRIRAFELNISVSQRFLQVFLTVFLLPM